MAYESSMGGKAVVGEGAGMSRFAWRPARRCLHFTTLFAALALTLLLATFAAAECNKSITDLYAGNSPAVVSITSLTINPYREDDRIRRGLGSGFIIDTHGLVMTNSHVVFGAQALTVTLDDGTMLPAKLLGADPIFDLAVLEIPKPDHGTLPVLTFGDSDTLRPGDQVIAIGNPMGLDQTVTSGIVSGLNRVLPERPRLLARPMIQTDAPINPGNSGGPLLNRCGEVIGITSEILGDAQNIGFAIPSNLARAVVLPLVEKGKLSRPWFGIDGGLIDHELRKIFTLPLADGFLVEAVEQGSPAAAAGIVGGTLPVKVGSRALVLGGDIIVAMNGIDVRDGESLQRALKTITIGKRAHLKVFRKGKTVAVDFDIIERPLLPGDLSEAAQSVFLMRGSDSSPRR